MASAKIICGLALAAFTLASCAQQEEPGPIWAEPAFTKMGEPCRPSGQVPIPGTAMPDLPPCDCDEDVYDANGNLIPCPPPPPRRPDDDDDDDRPNDPTFPDPQ